MHAYKRTNTRAYDYGAELASRFFLMKRPTKFADNMKFAYIKKGCENQVYTTENEK